MTVLDRADWPLPAWPLVVVGSQQRHLPPLFGPARNGTIVFGGTDQDIYRLDPVTGTSVALITGSASDSDPWLSPDGTKFLFLRGSVTDPSTGLKNGNDAGGECRREATSGADRPAHQSLRRRVVPTTGARVAIALRRRRRTPLCGFSTWPARASLGTLDIRRHDAPCTSRSDPGDRELTFRGSPRAQPHRPVCGRRRRRECPDDRAARAWATYASLSPDGTKIAYQSRTGSTAPSTSST